MHMQLDMLRELEKNINKTIRVFIRNETIILPFEKSSNNKCQ